MEVCYFALNASLHDMTVLFFSFFLEIRSLGRGGGTGVDDCFRFISGGTGVGTQKGLIFEQVLLIEMIHDLSFFCELLGRIAEREHAKAVMGRRHEGMRRALWAWKVLRTWS